MSKIDQIQASIQTLAGLRSTLQAYGGQEKLDHFIAPILEALRNAKASLAQLQAVGTLNAAKALFQGSSSSGNKIRVPAPSPLLVLVSAKWKNVRLFQDEANTLWALLREYINEIDAIKDANDLAGMLGSVIR